MTVLVFLVSLLGAMALGMPIAISLLVCGVALMLHLGMFDAQILARARCDDLRHLRPSARSVPERPLFMASVKD